MQRLKVQGHSTLVRDVNSGAIISTNRSDYALAVERKQKRDAEKQEMQSMCDEINSLKNEISDIKSLLMDIARKQ
jgi:hypothetical protein